MPSGGRGGARIRELLGRFGLRAGRSGVRMRDAATGDEQHPRRGWRSPQVANVHFSRGLAERVAPAHGLLEQASGSVKDGTSAGDAMDTLRQDLQYAVRSLRQRPGFTTVAVLTLALGIGVTTAMFSVVRGILLRPLPYPDSERLVTVWESSPEDATSLDAGLISHPNFRDVKSEVSALESIALVNSANLTLIEDGAATLVHGAFITPGLFDVFRVPLERGRDFSDAENRYQGPAVAIVSADYWRDRLGGREDVLTSSLRVGGRAHRIVGVAGAGFHYPSGADVWVPAQNDEVGCARGCVNRWSVARLARGASVRSARGELAALATRLEKEYPDTNANTTFAVASLHAVTVGDVRPALWILFGAVALVLFIACANVANLLFARGRSRESEVAVRATLGAGGRRILRQLMTESGLLAVVGGLAGVGVASAGVDGVLALAPRSIPRLDEVALDPVTLVFAGLLVAVSTFLFGLAPALALA